MQIPIMPRAKQESELSQVVLGLILFGLGCLFVCDVKWWQMLFESFQLKKEASWVTGSI